jgi:WD40 repeat protein/serine/threonine protein kinase
MSLSQSQPPPGEEEIFHTAAELTASARSGYLLAACAGRPEVRGRVERLLKSHDNEEFMLRGAEGIISPNGAAELARFKPEQGGEQIGNYKLIEQLGEGGFGTVWLAEQIRPVRRQVAFKIIKPGMDTKEVIARFGQERQALALMDHPNIAKVLDAGVTPLGRPFFVMELVLGIRITDYCERANLHTRERLELFIRICQAIQHAHQKGIIHRDIKPSNILVALHDGVALPKVIDFGIVKATEGHLADGTIYTQLNQFVGTPAYMSPEQAGMGRTDVDTRSDIYSLGVLLYELLVGKTPFDAQELMASGLDEMRRTIREKEPVRPSTQLTRQLVGDDVRRSLKSPAAGRSEEEIRASSRRLLQIKETIPLLKGDLDWVVMKCLEKDRCRRYGTANDLAADLKRHLANEPVVARPPSTAYKLQKTWRRNKLALTATAAVTVALLAGIVLSTWQAFKANAEKTIAQHHLYVANLKLARQAWEERNFARLQQLLQETRAFPTRGFEWYYWQRQAHLNLLTLHGHAGHVASAVFSRDGARIISGGSDKTARVWDSSTGLELFQPFRHDAVVNCVAVSPDGRQIVTGTDDGTAIIWDIATHRELFRLTGHAGAITSVAFSSDGRYIVTGGADHTARLWDASTGHELRKLEGHTGRINAVAISPNGRRIATASEDQTARLWDVEQVRKPLVLNGHNMNVLSLSFSPEGDRLVTGHLDRIARLWDTATGFELLTDFRSSGPIGSVAFSPDGKMILTGTVNSSVDLWDAASGTNLQSFVGHSRGVFAVAFSPDGQQIVTAGRDLLKVWAVSSSQESLAFRGKKPGSLAVAISPDNRLTVAGGTYQADGSPIKYGPESVEVWEMASGKSLRILTGHTSAISSAAFSPDGRWIVTGSKDQTAIIWETATGKESFRLEGHRGPINSVAFSPDGKWILTGSQDHTARIWAVDTHRVLIELIGHSDSVTSAAFSGDGTRIATGSLDNTVRIWEALTGRKVCSLQSPGMTRIQCVAFSPNGKRVAAGGYEKASIWNFVTGVEVCEMTADTTPVNSIFFSGNGQRVFTGSLGGTARVWEAATGQELLTLTDYGRVGMSLALSGDGLRLLTGSIDMPARLWQSATPEQVAAWYAEEPGNKKQSAVRP